MVNERSVKTIAIVGIVIVIAYIIYRMITSLEKTINVVSNITSAPSNIAKAITQQASLTGQAITQQASLTGKAGRDASGFTYVYNGGGYYLNQAETAVTNVVANIQGFGGGGGGVR